MLASQELKRGIWLESHRNEKFHPFSLGVQREAPKICFSVADLPKWAAHKNIIIYIQDTFVFLLDVCMCGTLYNELLCFLL